MDITTDNIEDLAEKTGEKIALAIRDKYGEPLGFSETHKIKREIFERALHETTAFFINHGDAKFDEKIIEVLRSHLGQRVENQKLIKKLNPKQLFANVIITYVNDFLLEEGIVV